MKNSAKLAYGLILLAGNIHAAPLYKDSLAPAQSDWEFHVAPYLWTLNMDGTTQIGTQRAHVDESFSDLLNHMNFAGMVWLDANRGRFGVFLNSMYAVLSDTANDGPVDLNAKAHFGLFSGGISYKFPLTSQFALTPYAGFRYTLNNASLKVSIPGETVNASKNVNWTDPIVGVRALYQFNKAWSLLLAGDVGGTSMSTDNSYNMMGLIGYQPQTMMTNTTMYFGYRQLKQLYQTGSGRSNYLWNMTLAGPLIGIDIKV